MSDRRYRFAIVISHPIQYQAPLFHALAAHPRIQLTVYFCSDIGSRTYRDQGFGVDVRWDIPLRSGYDNRVLRNVHWRASTDKPWGLINPGIVHALSHGRYDAVLVHGWNLATCWLAFATASRLRIPFLIRGESNGLAEPGGLKGLAKRVLLHRLFSAANGAVAIGTLNQWFYDRYGVSSDKVFLAPYSVDNCFFRQQACFWGPQRQDFRARHGIRPDSTVFLFVGKLVPVKRPLDLLSACRALGAGDDLHLVYVGDGELRATIEATARDYNLRNVRVTGFRNQSEISSWYAIADVLVVPSSFEPWGLVVNEAMNFGLPIIASDMVGSAPDLVLEGRTGFVFPAGDVEILASLMHLLHADPTLRVAIGQGALNRIREWGIPETVQGLVRAVESVVGA